MCVGFTRLHSTGALLEQSSHAQLEAIGRCVDGSSPACKTTRPRAEREIKILAEGERAVGSKSL